MEADDEDFAALLAGSARAPLRLADGGLGAPEVLTMLRELARSIGEDFLPSAWMMVEDCEVAGLCSVTKVTAANRSVEIGYGVAASRRERGIAGRAITDVVHRARADARVDAVTADTAVENIPSQRVLERCGFERVGMRSDAEDGAVIC